MDSNLNAASSVFERFCVIIPCRDEEISITQTIQGLLDYVKPEQIFVVDNDSKDLTAKTASALGVRVLFEPKQGKGFAVRNGFDQIPKDTEFVFMLDGDDTYSVEALPSALDLMIKRNLDMVIGTRKPSQVCESKKESGEIRSSEFRTGHSIGNQGLTFLYRVLFKLDIEDTLSGWRLMTYPFIKSFSGGDSGFEIETELNVHAYSLARPIANIDVSYRGRAIGSESKLRTFKDGFQITQKMVNLFRHEKPVTFMFLLSIPFGTAGIILILRAYFEYLQFNTVKHFPSLILGTGLGLNFFFLNLTGLILSHIQEGNYRIMRFQYMNANNR